MSDDDGNNVCDKCGAMNLRFEEEGGEDVEYCENCSKEGPWCLKCITHHKRHCLGKEDDDDISEDSSCSDCEDYRAKNEPNNYDYKDGFLVRDGDKKALKKVVSSDDEEEDDEEDNPQDDNENEDEEKTSESSEEEKENDKNDKKSKRGPRRSLRKRKTAAKK